MVIHIKWAYYTVWVDWQQNPLLGSCSPCFDVDWENVGLTASRRLDLFVPEISPGSHRNWLWKMICSDTGWWYFNPSEKWWTSSVGMMNMSQYDGKNKHFPNHQPVLWSDMIVLLEMADQSDQSPVDTYGPLWAKGIYDLIHTVYCHRKVMDHRYHTYISYIYIYIYNIYIQYIYISQRIQTRDI